ncbi:hypothetical protein D3C71_77440 [compost metagenome]
MDIVATDKLAAFLALMSGVREMLRKHPKDLPVITTLAVDLEHAREVLRFSVANTNVVNVHYRRLSQHMEELSVEGPPLLQFEFTPPDRRRVFPEVIEVIYQRLTRGIEATP